MKKCLIIFCALLLLMLSSMASNADPVNFDVSDDSSDNGPGTYTITISRTITFTYSISMLSQIAYGGCGISIVGTPFRWENMGNNYTISGNFTLSPGTYEFRAYAQHGRCSGTFKYNNTSEDVITLFPINSTFTGCNTTISWGNTNPSGLTHRRYKIFNGSDSNDITSQAINSSGGYIDGTNAIFNNLAGGSYQLYVRAYDDTNYASYPSNSISFIVDTTPPSGSGVYINNSGDRYTNNPEVTVNLLNFSDSQSGIYQASFDYNNSIGTWININTSNMTVPYTITTSDGPVNISVWVSDCAGNVSSRYDCVITLDTREPSTPNTPLMDYSDTDTVVWTWERATDVTSGVKQYLVTIKEKETNTFIIKEDVILVEGDLVSAETITYSYSGLLDRKTYEFMVIAEDNAGNRSDPASHTVTIIRSAPVITLPDFPIRFNNGNLTFCWNPVSGADVIGFKEYQVAVTEELIQPDDSQIIFTSPDSNINTVTISRSSRNTCYLWVRAMNQNIEGDWTMAGPFPDFIITGPENGRVIDEATFRITVSPRTTGKDLRYKVRYQAEAEVLESVEVGAGIETTIELPFEANWRWWIEAAEYQDGARISESVVVTEAFNLRFDRNNSTVTSRGTLYEDEIWWSGIHYIIGDVIVPEGLTLTIEQGTQVICITNPDSKPALIIRGEMITGTGSSFTPNTGLIGDWRGIIVEGKAALEGATIKYAERGLAALDGAEVNLTGCTFENNLAGVHAYNSTPAINSCIFRNNVYGIKEDEGGRPVVKGCRFIENGVDYYHQELTEINMEQLNDLPGNEGNQVGN